MYVPHTVCIMMFMKHVISWILFVNTENVMLLFVFVSFLSPSVFLPFYIWLLTALSFPHSILFFLSLLIFTSLFVFPCSLLCFFLFGSPFPSLSFPLPAGRGHRKLVDCPQLLDVDDMVKMREPDWKCVYTYLQEFYRGLVTKGLVKTKNSS